MLSVRIVTLLLSFLLASPAGAQLAKTAPSTQGDQLLFFYDATTSRVPFLIVTNQGDPLVLQVSWYGRDLSLLLSEVRSVERETVIFDPSSRPAVSGHLGLATVTPVRGPEDPTPIVPRVPLLGGFTLANTEVGSGFGQNPLGREAVASAGARPSAGSAVNGSAVRYQTLSPAVLQTPFFFNPTTPGLTSQFLLAAFHDDYGAGTFSISPASVSLQPLFRTATDGSVFGSGIELNGVVASSLSSLAPRAFASSGSVRFDVTGLQAGDNVFGLFSQSLGTFAVGQRLPGQGDGIRPTESTGHDLAGLDVHAERIGRFDLSNSSPDSGDNFDFQVSQVFTVGDTGTLANVRVALRPLPDSRELLTLEIQRASGGMPQGNTVFAATSRAPSALRGADPNDPDTWPVFDFRSLRLPVSAGESLAFTLRTHDAGYEVFVTDESTRSESFWFRNQANTLDWTRLDRTSAGYVVSVDR